MLWARASVEEPEEAQRKLKAELLLDGSALLDMTALGVGDGELAFGVDFLVREVQQRKLPYVSANLANEQGKLLFPAFRVVESSGLRIGITSVLSDKFSFPDAQVLPVSQSLRDALAVLKDKEKVELVVLLSHLGLPEDKALAKQFPSIDLIFGGHSRSHQEEPLLVGTTAIMQAGSRGKHLGEVTIELREGAVGWFDPEAGERSARQRKRFELQLKRFEQQLENMAPDDAQGRARLERVRGFTEKKLADLAVVPEQVGISNLLRSRKVAMDRKIADHAPMQALVDAALEKMGPDAHSSSGHDHHGHDHHGHAHHDHGVHGAGRPHAAKKTTREYGDFVGAKICMACHRAIYDDWMTTRHAHAYGTLVADKRHFDLDCWSCHVTGAGKPGGPSGPYDVGTMRNVQCEACHGPGRKHIADPTAVDMVRNPGEAHCKSCHSDEQTDSRFVYEEYLPKVDHKP
ncbi:MAG TPA: hypothetical protein DIU15_13640 [Deltaproteobacteria bacterium]|nr:hypothetical protein [Deltaproteobacteria bacterium]HCP47083.1 hypothetical protein [Deltaproteobacteria bacterium]